MQDARIEDDAIARLGRDPVGIGSDDLYAAEARKDLRNRARSPIRLGLALARQSVAASDESKLESARLEALQINTDPHAPIRLVSLIPVRTNAGFTCDIVAVPGKRREPEVQVVVGEIPDLGTDQGADR